MAPRNQQPEMVFQSKVIALTHGRNLRVAVLNPARFGQRIEGNKGFPDLMIVGLSGILFRELKTQDGAWRGLRPDQTVWRNWLKVSGQDWDIWTPADLDSGRIERELAAIETQDEYTDVWSLVQLDITPVVFDADNATEDVDSASGSMQQTGAVTWADVLNRAAAAMLLAINQR